MPDTGVTTTDQVTDTFTYPCKWCGVKVQVDGGKSKPHTCRIDIDAQVGHA